MIVRETPIKGTKAGRKDYSNSIELSTIPVIRSFQEVANYWYQFRNVPAGGSATTHVKFKYAHFIFDAGLSASANVLIVLEVDSEGFAIIRGKGYQRVPVEIPASFPVDEIDITVRNYGDVPVDIWYWHLGVMGLEKIEPFI